MTTVDNALIVMTKVPQPGQSKTRLVPPLSYDEAADLARALLLDQLNNLSQFSQAARHIAFTPAAAAARMQALALAGFAQFPQSGSDLGERMAGAFGQLFAGGFARVVLIGGDLPALPLTILADGFTALYGPVPQVVLGPSADGGYYLIGMNRFVPEIFTGITWSRPDVLQRTVERLMALEIPYKLLASWYDIDTIGDLRQLMRELIPPHQDFMKNTCYLLRQFKQRKVF
jgi:rSAM/selenodomain-associated transferase 1